MDDFACVSVADLEPDSSCQYFLSEGFGKLAKCGYKIQVLDDLLK